MVGSGREALARLRAGERYDVIVSDVMMPDLSGPDLHDTIASEDPAHARRMIFMTGGAFTLRTRLALEKLAHPRIDKPFEARALRALVERMLADEVTTA